MKGQMGKKKNDDRVQMKTPGVGEPSNRGEGKEKEEYLVTKTQSGTRNTKDKENENVTKMTSLQNLQNPMEKKESFKHQGGTQGKYIL